MEVHDVRVVNGKGYDPGERLAIYVGRPTPLGNKFINMPRERAIELYREWLKANAAKDVRVQFQLFFIASEALRQPIDLVCSCAPLACHADVVREMVIELAEGIRIK